MHGQYSNTSIPPEITLAPRKIFCGCFCKYKENMDCFFLLGDLPIVEPYSNLVFVTQFLTAVTFIVLALSFILDQNDNFLKMLIPTNIYLFKVNNGNFGKLCEICSKLTMKTPERRHWLRSGVFIVNFGHISHLFLIFLLLTLNK